MSTSKVKRNSAADQYQVVVEDAVIKETESQPTLDEIREIVRTNGSALERIDILNSELECSRCRNDLSERFASDMSGSLLCWDCANGLDEDESSQVHPSVDPAKVVLSKSALYHKSLCDYVINVATGCTHGCKFCYVPSTPNISARQDMLKARSGVENSQEEWGSYLLYRDDLPERLARKLERKQKWNYTERGRGVVMLSSGTDCYQDRRTAQITRGCVTELVKHRIPVRILTRSPAVLRDIDLFKKATELTTNGMLVRVGSSIPCLDEEAVKAIEPDAPIPSARLNALQELSDAGVPVYVSMSPTYPTQTYADLESLIKRFAELGPEVVFHEPINPRGQNFKMTIQAAEAAEQYELARELEALLDHNRWLEYSLEHMTWVEQLGEKYDVDVHVWPDKQVIESSDRKKAEYLKQQKQRPSPEQFPEVPLPT